MTNFAVGDSVLIYRKPDECRGEGCHHHEGFVNRWVLDMDEYMERFKGEVLTVTAVTPGGIKLYGVRCKWPPKALIKIEDLNK